MVPSSPRKILIFCLPGIGDAILFTPALAMLRRAFPDARFTAVTMFRGTAEILETNPDLDEVRHFDFFNATRWEGIRYVWGLRRERHDLSIMPFPSNRLEYNVVNWLTGARWRAAHRYQHEGRRNADWLNNISVTERGDRHNIQENLRLAEAVLGQFGRRAAGTEEPRLRVHLTSEDRQYAESFLATHQIDADKLIIGYHTHSSTFKNMHRKCWPKENFVALIERLSALHPHARHLIFSGPADAEVNRWMMQQVNERVVLVEEPNLRHALAILERCRLFVSNDSAIMHLAAALKVPVVALFGPTNWRRLYPWIDARAIVRRELPCMPCFYYSSRPLGCPAGINYACIQELSVDSALDGVQQLLADHEPSPHEVVQSSGPSSASA